MAQFTLQEIQQALPGCQVLAEENTVFADVVTDSRKITVGALFVAIKGERFNGEVFVQQAAAAGAAGVLVSSEYKGTAALGITVLQAAGDTQSAYLQLAAFHRRRFHLPVIAITGSNGKTTTKDMTAAVLASQLSVLKTQKNFNNEIGLPFTLLQLAKEHQAAVVEIGMRGMGQIKALAPIAAPDIAIVTNVGETHIELLGSVENIAKAKGELVEAISAGGTVILNHDNPYTAAMKHKAAPGVKVLTFGMDSEADIKAEQIELQENKTLFKCRLGKNGDVYDMEIPLLGKHNVSNALAAIAAGYCLGITPEHIAKGLANMELTGMRFQRSRIGWFDVINDAYNASPMSMEASLKSFGQLAQTTGRRGIAVLGDMLELGDTAKTAHQRAGVLAATHGVSVLITLGDMGQEIAQGAISSGLKETYICQNKAEALHRLLGLLKPDDMVLFKASRGMKLEKLIEALNAVYGG